MSAKWRDHWLRWDFLVVALAFLLAIPAERGERFAALEVQFDAFRHLLRTHVEFDERILFVNTDEEFFDRYGSWPLRRVDLARIAANLDRLGARTVALDVLMDFPSAYGEDEPTAAILAEIDDVLLVSQGVVEDGEMVEINRPVPVLDAAARTGYTNLQSASFLVETMSRLTLYPDAARFDDGWPFAVQALSLYLDQPPSYADGVLAIGDDIRVPLDRFDAFLIDFPSVDRGETSIGASITLGAWDVLNLDQLPADEVEELRAWVEDRLVLVGDTSEVSHDYFDTPIGSVYGVELIGATINTLMQNAPLRPAGFALEIGVTLLMAALSLLTGLIAQPLPRLGATLVIWLSWFVAVFALYAAAGIALSVSYVLVAGAVANLAINARFYLQERSQKALIRDAFGQYLSPKVVAELVKDPDKLQLGGETRQMTAFFSDIAGFSTISEQLTPQELVSLLNEYLTLMCSIIADYDGTVDKFEGDAIMSFWGAPLRQLEHAKYACYAAIDMDKNLAEYRARLEAQGRPLLRVRMGMNSGDMLVGNMGSQQRMDYTVMGDAVNLASRLEGANKFYGTWMMISEFTQALAGEHLDVRELDRIRVVGKREAVTVFELLDRRGSVTGKRADVVEAYLRGIEAWKQMNFAGALRNFMHALELDPFDGPSKTYVERCEAYLLHPPAEDWDGVWQLDSKG